MPRRERSIKWIRSSEDVDRVYPGLRSDWESSILTLEQISTKYGIKICTFRAWARKFEWQRDKSEATKAKARIVGAAIRGKAIPEPPPQAPHIVHYVFKEAQADIHDCGMALANARRMIEIVAERLALEGREMSHFQLKTFSEINRINLEVVLRIRDLGKPDEEEESLTAIYERILDERDELPSIVTQEANRAGATSLL